MVQEDTVAMSKPKDKREAIMRSALKLFTTKGFDNTSTANISKNAGVGTGTLFNYFDSKEALINELYLETKKEFMGIFPPLSDDTLLTEEVVRTFWDLGINWGIRNPDKMKFIVMYKSSPYITKLTQSEIADEMELLGDLYQRSIEEGLIKDLPIDYLMEATTSHMYATILYLTSRKIKDPKVIEDLFPTGWDMIRK